MEKETIELKLAILEMRFRTKVFNSANEYYLAYSGGRDSHFLLWFIREYIHDKSIPVVAVNTRMEHPELRQRMEKYADEILYPTVKPFEIKERRGIPCFSKFQDEMIERYQRGSRSYNTMCAVTGKNRVTFKLNNKARELLLADRLHRISNKCCLYTKKKPQYEFQKRTGMKPILGIRGAEGMLRKSQFRTCLDKKGNFSPLYDFDDNTLREIERLYNIEVPQIYNTLNRTGCFGCPYGWRCGKGNTVKELSLLSEAQKKFVCELFKESYEVLGVNKCGNTGLKK